MWIACRTVFGWKFMEHLPKLAEWMDYEPAITEHVTQGLPANRLGRMKALSGGRVRLGDHDHGSGASGESPAPYGTRRSCKQSFANSITMHRRESRFHLAKHIRGQLWRHRSWVSGAARFPRTFSIHLHRQTCFIIALENENSTKDAQKATKHNQELKSLLNGTTFAAISEWWINRKSLDKAEDYKFLCIMSLRSKSRAMLVIPFMIWSLQRAWKWLKWSCRQ